jgi:16S rRNA (cytidine1402-2'-O)-methyltransferase
VVATPIGNLGDLTFRALDTLRAADIIACEDTRHSRRLLDHYGVTGKRLVSLHAHNEAARTASLVPALHAGAQVALLTDAGTPGISDPGGRLVQACIREGISYQVIPGPSAVTTAAVGSGLVPGGFTFEGFLPSKAGGRATALQAALARPGPTVFFESPQRLHKSLDLVATAAPDRLVCVCRELTKTFEEFRRGRAADVADHYRQHPPKGEIALVVSGTDLPKWVTGQAGDEPEQTRTR